MIIREAKLTDQQQLAEFQVLMAWETEKIKLNRTLVEAGVSAALNDVNKGKYYVVELENKLVASLLITYEWSDWRNGTVYWIQSVYVREEFRKQGIYGKMYDYIKNLVSNDKNILGIRLYVDKTNTNAQKIYKNNGMTDNHYTMFEWMK